MADRFLQSVVRNVERLSGGLGVTLSINGVVISGRLVSEEEYVKGMALDYEKRRNLADDEATEATEQSIDLYNRLFSRQASESQNPVHYFHLENPVIHQGGPNLGISGRWWRGSLEEVDGFQLSSPISTLRKE